MTIRSTALAFRFASRHRRGAFRSPMPTRCPCRHDVDVGPDDVTVPLPGQPGADTTQDQELRGQPYPASTAVVAVQADAAMKTSQMSPSIYGSLSLPETLIFN